MLYITHNEIDYSFHLGDKIPAKLDPACVTEVQADGDELEAIRLQFENIPMSNGYVVHWFGAIAKFIAANIKM